LSHVQHRQKWLLQERETHTVRERDTHSQREHASRGIRMSHVTRESCISYLDHIGEACYICDTCAWHVTYGTHGTAPIANCAREGGRESTRCITVLLTHASSHTGMRLVTNGTRQKWVARAGQRGSEREGESAKERVSGVTYE